MCNISEDKFEEIVNAMGRPEGTIFFTLDSVELFNCELSLNILQIISGGQLFILEKDKNMKVNFYHSSPGTGTRIATIDLTNIKRAEKLRFFLIWSTTELRLVIGPLIEDGELITAEGNVSPIKLRIAADGVITRIGDEGVQIMEERVYVNGKSVLEPTAIDNWNNTIQAIKILQSGASDEGYIYEVVQTNLTISTLVTGFEVYCRKRCIELEEEGLTPNLEALVNRIFSRLELENKVPETIKKEAEDEGQTLFKAIIKNKINFQNYEQSKKAFSKAYNIKFGDLGLTSNELSELQKFIQFRHRIIHVSPLLAMLNQLEVPPDEPVFSNKILAEKAIELFDRFINSLHGATLSLRSN